MTSEPDKGIYDVLIAGAGPAGIAASIYAARKKMTLKVLTIDIGGQTVWTGDIENYMGYQFISGADLSGKFEEHIKQYSIEVNEEEPIRSVEKRSGLISVFTDSAEYISKTLIIATGKRPRELDVPGEKEFRMKGVAYCATCDAPFFAGKSVAVAGGGNSALESALQLSRIAEKVYIVNISSEITGDAIIREKLEKDKKVEILNDSSIKAIRGADFVESIEISRSGISDTLDVQGVFVEIGLIPNTSFKSPVELNEKGEIKVNMRNETDVPGIFACGDVTDVPEKQIIIAAGEGAKAALRAFNFISRNF